MPFRSHYVLRRDFPRRLNYRNAALHLQIVRRPFAGGEEWVLQAAKFVHPDCCIILASRTGRYALETMLFEEGFVLGEGSPAARILDRLTREGHAFSRPARMRG